MQDLKIIRYMILAIMLIGWFALFGYLRISPLYLVAILAILFSIGPAIRTFRSIRLKWRQWWNPGLRANAEREGEPF